MIVNKHKILFAEDRKQTLPSDYLHANPKSSFIEEISSSIRRSHSHLPPHCRNKNISSLSISIISAATNPHMWIHFQKLSPSPSLILTPEIFCGKIGKKSLKRSHETTPKAVEKSPTHPLLNYWRKCEINFAGIAVVSHSIGALWPIALN